jgi:hypothetical protein
MAPDATEAQIQYLFEAAVKSTFIDRDFWYIAGRESTVQPTWRGRTDSTSHSMLLAREDSWFYVGEVDLGNSAAASNVRSLREGVISKLYGSLERNSRTAGR